MSGRDGGPPEAEGADVPELASPGGGVPDVAYAVALAALRDMTPVRLSRLLAGRPAQEVYSDLLTGDPKLVGPLLDLPSFGGGRARRAEQDPAQLPMEEAWGSTGSAGEHERARARVRATLRAWRDEAGSVSVPAKWAALQERGIGAVRRRQVGYPTRLERAQTSPEVVYYRGSITQASGPCVAIVGTRRATHYGQSVAAEFGRALADLGVVVVSGLALGIDAAAHGGALASERRGAGPLGVAGGGVDVIYPPANRRLWAGVITAGGVLSEAPPGAPAEGWRFPLRNRLIAALSHVLVVVESARQGGAMHTVQAADVLGVPVLAVPGSIRSPQSEGTNAIIQAGGAGIASDVADVLVALEVACMREGTPLSWRASDSTRSVASASGGAAARQHALEEALRSCDPDERAVFEALEDTPTTVDDICLRSRLSLEVVALALDHLEELGLARASGPDWQRA